MQQNGCDTAALQRFDPNTSEGPTRDAMAARVNTAAQAYGRKFYIMYDATGWTNMATEMPPTGRTRCRPTRPRRPMPIRTASRWSCIWGFGFNDANHPWDAATCLSVVNFFKNQGCYVIGGVPREWRTGTGGSRAGYLGVYHAFNMLSPWMVGAIATAADSDNAYTTYTVPDEADCTANGIDYQPCVLPGDVSSGTQRAHGDFMWRQFYNMCRAGAQGIYISMFDEYGEGNQIAKTAATQAGVPAGSGLLSLDQDGTACSSDYYLRLTNDGGRMLKGQIALTATRPTQPTVSGGGTTPGTVVSFRAMANNMIVTADNAGASPLIANRTAVGTWESFDLINNSNGTISASRPRQQHDRDGRQRRRVAAHRQPHRDRHLGAVHPDQQLQRHDQPARHGQQHDRDGRQRRRVAAHRQPHRDRHLGAVHADHRQLGHRCLSRTAASASQCRDRARAGASGAGRTAGSARRPGRRGGPTAA